MRYKKIPYLILVGFWGVLMTACSSKKDDEPTPPQDSKPLIILDTDIGSSTDDLFAMQMLYDYDRRGLCSSWVSSLTVRERTAPHVPM